MARTLIAANENGAHGGGMDNLTFTDADATNDHYFPNGGKARLLARNMHASPQTVTVKSVTCSHGREEDIELTVPAIDTGVPGLAYAGPFDPGLFNQRGAEDLGNVHVDIADDTLLALAVVTDA